MTTPNVINPRAKRDAKMFELCQKWEKAEYVGFINGYPNFAFRIYVNRDRTVLPAERRDEVTCLTTSLERGLDRVVRVENSMIFAPNGTPFGAEKNVIFGLMGRERAYHNQWSFGPGRRFYE